MRTVRPEARRGLMKEPVSRPCTNPRSYRKAVARRLGATLKELSGASRTQNVASPVMRAAAQAHALCRTEA